jgi:DNA modification methylase
METGTIWSFPERGNWSPYVPRNLILRYSQESDFVLDQFAGGGTTLIEAKLLNRNILGVDINPAAIERCRGKTAFDYPNAGQVHIRHGDARRLDFVPDASVDFVCTYPPYADIIKYSEDIDGDLSRLAVKDFLNAMKSVSTESFRVLKPGKFCAILMGDTRKKSHVVPMSFEVMKIF